MGLDRKVIEELLYEHEGKALDFKKQNYHVLSHTSSEDKNERAKGEFLKDIVAFANTPRDGDAYILIGVDHKDRTDERARVIGKPLLEHDDGDLQSLVKDNLNAPVAFEYATIEIDGGTVAAFRILKDQERLVFMKRDVGGVKGNLCYRRQGSKTVVFTPDEIADLARRDATAARTLAVRISLGDKTRHASEARWPMCSVVLGRGRPIQISAMRALQEAEVTLAMMRRSPFNAALPADKDIEDHVRTLAIIQPVFARIENLGPATLREAKLILTIPQLPKLRLVKHPPPAPRTAHYSLAANLEGPSIEKVGDQEWQVTYSVGRVSAHDEHWGNRIWVGATEPCDVPITARLLGDGISPPIKQDLAILISTETGDLQEHMESFKRRLTGG